MIVDAEREVDIESEVEKPDVPYIQELAGRLLIEVNTFLDHHPTHTTNVAELVPELKHYFEGNFQMADVNLSKLRNFVRFLVECEGKEDEFGADYKRLST